MCARRRDPVPPARPLPVGGGWLGRDLPDPHAFRLPVPDRVTAELRAAAADGVHRMAHREIAGGLAAMPHTADFAAEVGRRLHGEPGFVVLTGFPAGDDEIMSGAYWLLGLCLGRPVSQSRKGDTVGRVEDRGADIANPNHRGYESAAALPFHVDRTDVVGLLCVRPADEGGLSRLVSAAGVHDLMLAEDPGLLAELYRPLPNDRRGEQPPGAPPWSAIPVFSRIGTSFALRYVRRFIEGAQRHPGAPRLTGAQRAAMGLLDDILHRPGVALDMALSPGEVQLINNFHLLHARTAFWSAGDGPGRLLLRLWLATAGSPELPPHYLPLYGATRGGSYRGGVWPPGAEPDTIGRAVADVPLPAFGPVPDRSRR